MSWTYATAPSDVVTDEHGNVVADRRLLVYDQPRGGNRVSDLQTIEGETLPGVLTTDEDGRYPFTRESETRPVLWLEDGQSDNRWALVAVEAAEAAGRMAHYASDVGTQADRATDAADKAEHAAEDASTSRSTARHALNEVTTLQTQIPTREELFFSAYIPARVTTAGNLLASQTGGDAGKDPGTAVGGAIISIMTAPYNVRLLSVSLSWEYWSIDADDTQFWEIAAIRIDGGTGEWEPVAVRTTQASGAYANGGINPRRPWEFGGADFGSGFASGDLFGIAIAPHGGVKDLNFGFTATVGYTPDR